MSEAGRVPFYVTCSNRLACSEVREFEYKVLESQAFGRETDDSTESLEARFVKLLCSKSDSPSSSASIDLSQVSEKISLLLFENDDQLDQMLMTEISQESMKEKLLQEALKESLHSWLLQKIAEGGKGPNVLEEGGQDFFGALRARVYDDEVRKFVEGLGVEKISKRLVNSREGPPVFEQPEMILEKLMEYGNMLVMEKENVKRVQLADQYLNEAALGENVKRVQLHCVTCVAGKSDVTDPAAKNFDPMARSD